MHCIPQHRVWHHDQHLEQVPQQKSGGKRHELIPERPSYVQPRDRPSFTNTDEFAEAVLGIMTPTGASSIVVYEISSPVSSQDVGIHLLNQGAMNYRTII